MAPRKKEETAKIRELRRKQILEAAVCTFANNGFERTNISDVASRAGVSHGTVYHYFRTKEELFMAVFRDWHINNLLKAYEMSLRAGGSSITRLRAFAQNTSHILEEGSKILPVQMTFWAHMVYDKEIREQFRLLFVKMRTLVSQILDEGIKNHELHAFNPQALAAAAVAMYDGLVLQWIADPQNISLIEISKEMVEALLKGIQKKEKKSP